MEYNYDTIIAQSTPIGYGGIGIIRISGKKSKKILLKLTGKITKNRYAEYIHIKNKNNLIIDYCIIIFFKSPNSYTGENILEIHCHGGQKIIELIIKSIINFNIKNVRLAYQGEFTERAFLNNKIDLIQAESIKNIIYAKSENSIFNATKLFKGYLSKKIINIINIIKKNLILIEKEIDFSEYHNNIKKINLIKKNIFLIYKNIKNIFNKYKKKSYFKNGIKTVIIGKPNVGKSSLINKITCKDTSIVTNIPGTTRDIIKEYININDIEMEIIDTAGIHKTTNIIEKIGIKKTWKIIKKSKIIIFMENALYTNEIQIINIYKKIILNKIKKYKDKIHILILNKIDLIKKNIKILNNNKLFNIINMSIKNNYGINKLFKIIKKKIKNINNNNYFLDNKRHIIIIKNILYYIKKCINIIKITNSNNINIDLIYEYLFLIQKKLYEFIGKKEITSKKIIRNIFSKFCIGK